MFDEKIHGVGWLLTAVLAGAMFLRAPTVPAPEAVTQVTPVYGPAISMAMADVRPLLSVFLLGSPNFPSTTSRVAPPWTRRCLFLLGIKA